MQKGLVVLLKGFFKYNFSNLRKNPSSFGENRSSSGENPSNFKGPSTIVEPTIVEPSTEPTNLDMAEPASTTESVGKGPVWVIEKLITNCLTICKEGIDESPEPEGVYVCHNEFPAPTEHSTAPSDHHNNDENRNMFCGAALVVARDVFGIDVDNLDRTNIRPVDLVPVKFQETTNDLEPASPTDANKGWTGFGDGA